MVTPAPGSGIVGIATSLDYHSRRTSSPRGDDAGADGSLGWWPRARGNRDRCRRASGHRGTGPRTASPREGSAGPYCLATPVPPGRGNRRTARVTRCRRQPISSRWGEAAAPHRLVLFVSSATTGVSSWRHLPAARRRIRLADRPGARTCSCSVVASVAWARPDSSRTPRSTSRWSTRTTTTRSSPSSTRSPPTCWKPPRAAIPYATCSTNSRTPPCTRPRSRASISPDARCSSRRWDPSRMTTSCWGWVPGSTSSVSRAQTSTRFRCTRSPTRCASRTTSCGSGRQRTEIRRWWRTAPSMS